MRKTNKIIICWNLPVSIIKIISYVVTIFLHLLFTYWFSGDLIKYLWYNKFWVKYFDSVVCTHPCFLELRKEIDEIAKEWCKGFGEYVRMLKNRIIYLSIIIMSVKVAVRVRPFNQREKFLGCLCCIQMKDKTTILINPRDRSQK